MKTLIHHATIVNEGRCEKADLIVAGNYIQEIILSPSAWPGSWAPRRRAPE